MVERRKHPRKAMPRKRVQVYVDHLNGNVTRGWLEDMSQDGIRIAGNTDGLTVGDELDVILLYPSTMKVRYRCKVAHIHPGEAFWGAKTISQPSLVGAELQV
jgi:hypothetical protein